MKAIEKKSKNNRKAIEKQTNKEREAQVSKTKWTTRPRIRPERTPHEFRFRTSARNATISSQRHSTRHGDSIEHTSSVPPNPSAETRYRTQASIAIRKRHTRGRTHLPPRKRIPTIQLLRLQLRSRTTCTITHRRTHHTSRRRHHMANGGSEAGTRNLRL